MADTHAGGGAMTQHYARIHMPHWPDAAAPVPEGDPRERVLTLLARMDHPQRRLPPVIHVAGTNGKGSTIAFLRAMLEAAGYRVHAYTSPHLHRFNERIRLAGVAIDDAALHHAIEAARFAADGLPVSFFEGTTAAAFYAFAHHPADVLLMETGMGGRFDPTNILDRPRLTLITSISYDHTEHLGRELSSIAWHKAGIMRTGVSCIVSHQPPEALKTLQREAEAIGAPLYYHGAHWAVERLPHGMRFIDGHGAAALPEPALIGPHQRLNAACAIAAITLLDEFDISPAAITHGLQHAQWPGRLERITSGYCASLLKDGWELWCDGGHNMAAGHMLAAMAETDWSDLPLYVIFGTTKGKDLAGMFVPLADKIALLCAVPVISEPGSAAPESICRTAVQAGIAAGTADSVADAVEQIIATGHPPGRILAFGSLYLRILVTAP